MRSRVLTGAIFVLVAAATGALAGQGQRLFPAVLAAAVVIWLVRQGSSRRRAVLVGSGGPLLLGLAEGFSGDPSASVAGPTLICAATSAGTAAVVADRWYRRGRGAAVRPWRTDYAAAALTFSLVGFALSYEAEARWLPELLSTAFALGGGLGLLAFVLLEAIGADLTVRPSVLLGIALGLLGALSVGYGVQAWGSAREWRGSLKFDRGAVAAAETWYPVFIGPGVVLVLAGIVVLGMTRRPAR
jgi:hypothetical protein